VTWRDSLGNVDTWRKGHLAVAEWIDAWRVVPRLLVAAYGWVVYTVIKWYMALEPKMIEGCTAELAETCVYNAPSTQHAALITAVIGISAAIFGLYTNSGKKWNGFTHWNRPGENGSEKPEEMQERTVTTKTVYVLDEDGDGG
jgi:hypothetical protein